MKTIANKTKCVLYARVSSDRQEKEGFSIPAQIKLLREYALRNGLKIVEEFVEAETAKKGGTNSIQQDVVLYEKTQRR